MSTENTHGSEACSLLQRASDLCIEVVKRGKHAASNAANLRNQIDIFLTTPPPLADEGGEAVAWQHRSPKASSSAFREWRSCSKEQYERSLADPEWEARALYAAPPTLAPSQGTAVTDEMIDNAAHALCKIDDPENAWKDTRWMAYWDRAKAALEAALASPAVREERVSEDTIADIARGMLLAGMLTARGQVRYVIDALRTHQKVAAAGDET